MERCGANTKRGAICGKPAGWGTAYQHGRCKLHGGASPTHPSPTGAMPEHGGASTARRTSTACSGSPRGQIPP